MCSSQSYSCRHILACYCHLLTSGLVWHHWWERTLTPKQNRNLLIQKLHRESFFCFTHCSVCRLDLLPHVSFQRSCASMTNVKPSGHLTVVGWMQCAEYSVLLCFIKYFLITQKSFLCMIHLIYPLIYLYHCILWFFLNKLSIAF